MPLYAYTIGIDLGDTRHQLCVLDAASRIVEEGSQLDNSPPAAGSQRWTCKQVCLAYL